MGVDVEPASASSLPSIVTRRPPGTTFCLTAGTYHLNRTIVPREGDSFIGAGPGRAGTIVDCSAVSSCFDIHSVSDVEVRTLVVRDAQLANIKLGLSTVVAGITSIGGGKLGLVASGGLGQAAAVVLKDSVVYRAATNCGAYGGPGYCAGFKVNAVPGIVVKNNLFRDNCGGAALWLDINSRDFQVEDNFAIDNDNASGQSSCGETEGIRVEISCFGTVSGNTVYGNAGAQIDLFNSNNMSVSDNRVTGQGSGGFAIRVLSSGRPLTRGGTGEGECASTDGAYHSFNNEITSNVVQLRGGSKSGAVAFDGHDSFDNEFRSNTYLGGRCWSESWVWWDGSSNVATDFLSWQREFNQDMSGACS